MKFNSRAIALLLAFSIAVITTAFLLLVPETSNVAVGIAFVLSFSSSYILSRLVLEFLFFRQIENITDELKSIKEGKLSLKVRKNTVNPLKRINREIKILAASKDKEIEILREREVYRREFLADISHELKTPIFAAQGFVLTLLDGAMNDKEVRKKFLKKAAKSLDALDLLVQDILTISQIEAGQIKMHFQNLDIVHLCKEVVDQLEEKAEKKGITLRFKSEYDEPIIVRGDYRRLYQVVTNLVTNSIKYTKKGGFAEISFLNLGDFIQISVADNGYGIPEEDINRIFERFYRVDKSRSREGGGTGLGLSIVKHILESHHSEIMVESEYGKGSRFYFKLARGSELTFSEEELA